MIKVSNTDMHTHTSVEMYKHTIVCQRTTGSSQERILREVIEGFC